MTNPVETSMTASLLEPTAPAWESVLRTAQHDFYHLPAYVALCARQEAALPRALYVADGRREMLLPLLVREIPGGGADAVSPYGYPGPVGIGTDDPAFLAAALKAGFLLLREAGLVSVFVRLHPLLNPTMPTGVGTVVIHGETVSVDLTLSDEELWSALRRDHRRDTNRAKRLGFVASVDRDWQYLSSFRRIYRETMERLQASPYYLFDDEYYDGLRDALGERLHLLIVERDGDLAGGGLFVETGGIVQFHLSASSESFLAYRPTKLLLHFATGWARARGCTTLHLGGGVGGRDDSLFHFKVGFSSVRHPFATLRGVLDEQEYSRLVVARQLHLDPADREGYFPLYRSG